MQNLICWIVGLVLFYIGPSLQDAPINKVQWIVGTWGNSTQRGMMYETWTKKNDAELAGKSYTLKGKDTVIFEHVQLLQKQNSLFYIPTVTNQNNNLPVSFSLQTISDNEMIFENLKHDFPQFISYKKITPDSLVAEISGKVNGQERTQRFPMRRIQ